METINHKKTIMNKERKQRFQNVISSLEEAKDELTDIQAEEIDALDIAKKAGQVETDNETLYSEDLY